MIRGIRNAVPLAGLLWAVIIAAVWGGHAIAVPAAVIPSAQAAIDTRYYTPTTSLRQVTNRTRIYSYVSSGFASGLARNSEVSYVPIRYIQVAACNWYVKANGTPTGVETGPGAATTWAYTLEYPKGTFTTLTWGGQPTRAVADGATEYTDLQDLGFTIPAYAKWWLWQYQANATAMVYEAYSNSYDKSRGDAFQFSTTNTPGTIADNGGGINTLFPCEIKSYSNRHVWMALGDSLTAGVNDLNGSPTGGQGFFGRALARLGPQLNMGSPGDRAQWFVASHAKRLAVIADAGVDYAIDAYGRNDISQSRTSAQLLADRETIRGYFTFPMFDATVTPLTTSTDSWKTAANQTAVSNPTVVTTFNTALRAGLTASPGLIDVASLVETNTSNETIPVLNGGVWLPRWVDTTGGGVHPSSLGYADPALMAQVESLIQVQGGQQ